MVPKWVDFINWVTQFNTRCDIWQPLVLFQDLFSTMKQTYGVEIVQPSEENVAVYSR